MDWADEKALELINTYLNNHDPETRLVMLGHDIADALRQAKAEARTHENQECIKLLVARVGATQ